VQRLFDPATDRQFALVYGQDHRMSALVIATQTEAALGFPDKAHQLRQEALREGQLTNHVYSRAYARSWSLHVYYYTRDIERMRQALPEALNYSTDQSILFWRIWAEMYVAWLVLEDGDYDLSITKMKESIDFLALTGTLLRMPMHAILAGAYFKKGETNQAMDVLDESLEIIRRHGEAHYEAETHRLRGDFLLSGKNDADAAEKSYLAALAVANSQEAKLFELRAATSLAQLWREQGRRSEAHDLLAPVYGWFTEGFDTADLKEAKALLDELA
jgi:tetratricopeptide (TPR) repeat protein